MTTGDDSIWPPPPAGPAQRSGGALPALGPGPLPFRGRRPPFLDPIPDWLTRSLSATVPALGPALVLSGIGVVVWLAVTVAIGRAFPLLAVVLPEASAPVRFALRVVPAVTGAVFFTAAAHAVAAGHLGYRCAADRSLRRVLDRLGPVLTVLVPLVAMRLATEMWMVRMLFRGPSAVRIVLLTIMVLLSARLLLALMAAVIGPVATNPYRQSWRLTSGGFVPMLGRTLALMGIAFVGAAVAKAVIVRLLTTPTTLEPMVDLYLAFAIEALINAAVLIVVNSAIADLYFQTGGEGDL